MNRDRLVFKPTPSPRLLSSHFLPPFPASYSGEGRIVVRVMLAGRQNKGSPRRGTACTQDTNPTLASRSISV
jgi:hypothetical protein